MASLAADSPNLADDRDRRWMVRVAWAWKRLIGSRQGC